MIKTGSMESLKNEYVSGYSFSDFLESTREAEHPWRDFYDRARVPEEVLSRFRNLTGPWHFLVLCEPWCGDGANILPYLARGVESNPALEMRVLPRDENLELMDAHLTNGNRGIPVVMILDEDFREVGWWGPRPAPLQELFLREIFPLPKEDRYPRVRAWYARDRGRTALGEILDGIPVPVQNPEIP